MIKLEIMGKTTESLLKTFEGYQNCVISVAFMIVCVFFYKTINFWEKTTGFLLKTFQDHQDCVRSVFFIIRGNMIASSSDDKTIKL